jgi:sulfoxide reductase heme-binding subunit YedZ
VRIAVLKTLVFIAALGPLGWLILGLFTDNLSANPIEYITRATGWFALMFLTASLSVTPVRRVTKWHPIVRFRRMLGLFAFFYGTLHLLTWVVLDKFFDVPEMVADVFKRPFITVGMATYLLLVPLAATSTAGMIRRLGGRRWAQLHRLAYVAGITAVLHFWWLVKSDVREPQRWAVALAVLLGLRAWWAYQARSPLHS